MELYKKLWSGRRSQQDLIYKNTSIRWLLFLRYIFAYLLTSYHSLNSRLSSCKVKTTISKQDRSKIYYTVSTASCNYGLVICQQRGTLTWLLQLEFDTQGAFCQTIYCNVNWKPRARNMQILLRSTVYWSSLWFLSCRSQTPPSGTTVAWP